MKKKTRAAEQWLDLLDCFGDYAKTNSLCAKHCVLRLRCAIEQDQNVRMELLSDLTAAEDTIVTYQ